MASRPQVAFSMGDPNGIGPEVLLKALKSTQESLGYQPLVFGDPVYLRRLADDCGLDMDWPSIEIVPVLSYPYPPPWGKQQAQAGAVALESLRKAAETCRDQDVRLLVTAPISKAAAASAAGDFPQGQTEFVGAFFPGAKPVMAFLSEALKVVLMTVHIPLKEVPAALDSNEIVRRVGLFHAALCRLGTAAPRIALCGLNPHASEDGLFGDEEELVLKPALQKLRRELGPDSVEGPFPPDTIFWRVHRGEFDGVAALYHDQGLIPLKLLAFDSAVNVSLGLPITRTSPDHGTAFDIAGSNSADPTSMAAAIEWGMRLAFPAAPATSTTSRPATRLAKNAF